MLPVCILSHVPQQRLALARLVDALDPATRAFAPYARTLAGLKGAAKIAHAAETVLELAAVLAARDPARPIDTVRAIAAIGFDDLVASAVITSLDRIADGVPGNAGTVVTEQER